MKPTLRLGLLALMLAFGATACKKPPPPPRPTPMPTATPVPATDVLAYAHMGRLFATNWNGTQTRLLAAGRRGEGLWFPAPAPDGSHFLAWLSRPDGTQDVVRVETSGRITQLTEIGARAEPAMKNLRLGNAPAFSPDGARVAYSFNGSIWLMDASGFNAETFIGDGASWAPAFSPDGKTLAYVNGSRGNYDLWLADLQSRDTWQLTDFGSFSVGHPRWSQDGKYIVLTRSQGDESDVVKVLASAETPLADADLLTKDKASSGAVFSPEFKHLLFTRIDDKDRPRLVVSDADGTNAKMLEPEDALAPAWMRPGTSTAMVFDAAPSRPTPVVQATATPRPAAPAAQPTAAAPAQPAPAQPAPAQPAPAQPAQPTAVPPKPTAVPTRPAPSPAQPSGVQPAPAQPAPVRPAPAQPSGVQPANVPTQPPLKAAPLRLRFKAGFNAEDGLEPGSLADLKTLGRRVRQYESSHVQVIGPLDGSALKGRYPSAEARSRARAQAVAAALAKQSGLDAAKVQAQPYAPATAGAAAPNSIQIYVELK